MLYNTTVCVGGSWGDEGKGAIVDYLSSDYNTVVRVQSGPNAGHTLKVKDTTVILRLIPSGILYDHTCCILANGMVIDPIVFNEEVKALEKMGIVLDDRLIVSKKAHVIFPHHIEIDKDKNGKIGTTKKGIGPCYEDKVGRRGIRIGQLLKGPSSFDKDVIDTIKRFVYKGDTSELITKQIESGMSVLFEGAQGSLLDIDHGTYPYVTSSNSIAGGACTGAGIGPTAINCTIGITKAYVTRVGAGPFPTILEGEEGDNLRKAGNEFGSVTKRSRSVGWLDLPLLKYAKVINSLSMLAVTKIDVLSGLNEIKVCTHYEDQQGHCVKFPDMDDLDSYIPVYKSFPGWKEDISEITSFDDLPQNAKNYLKFIGFFVELPICLVSVGPERNQIINLMDSAQDTFFVKQFAWVQKAVRDVVSDFVKSIGD